MEKTYLLTEKPTKALLLFALPMMVGNLFQQLYTMADSVIVGRFVGEGALAAVGASYSLTTVFISIAIGGGVGASVLTSRYFGAGEYQELKQSVCTALTAFLVLSFCLGLFGWFWAPQIMMGLNTPVDVLAQAIVYLRIYFLGLPFLFLYNVFSAMFNALGRSKIPLFLLIFSSVFNVLLDLVMVCYFGLGIAGVAWATLIAQGISAVLSFLLFQKEMTSYQTETVTAWFVSSQFVRMSKLALPSILQQSTVSIGMMLVQSVVNGGRFFCRYAGGEPLCGAHGSYGECDICLYSAKFGGKTAGTGKTGISCRLWHCVYHCTFALFGFGAFLPSVDCVIFGRRRNCLGFANRFCLFAVYGLVFCVDWAQDDYRRTVARCWPYAAVYHCEFGQSGAAGGSGHAVCTQVWHCHGLGGSAHWLAGQLFDLFYGLSY